VLPDKQDIERPLLVCQKVCTECGLSIKTTKVSALAACLIKADSALELHPAPHLHQAPHSQQCMMQNNEQMTLQGAQAMAKHPQIHYATILKTLHHLLWF
jgi:hypothetical protein